MAEATNPGTKQDYTFGQVAIRENICTFEQVKECLDIQGKLRSLGIEPKKLGEILIEKGYLTSDQAAHVSKLQVQSMSQQRLNIPGYEFISKIGQGAIGAVYKAKQVSMDRVVAIKILSPKYSKDPGFVERFLREARAVAKLHHENVISGIDVGEANGVHYLVMEFVDGVPVINVVKKEGRLDEKRCLTIGLQVTKALNHAHKHGLVHRDVKPENVMVTHDNVAKLCDLGLAKQAKGDAGATMDGTCVGTPNYISPEQARGEENIDIRTDIYSLGASLYHMATGVTPFNGPNPMVVMTKHVTEFPEPPKKRNPAISDGFNNLILKMMSKRREDRHADPDALILDLERLLHGGTVAAAAPAPTGRKPASTIAKPGSESHPARHPSTGRHHFRPQTSSSSSLLVVGGVVVAVVIAAVYFMSGSGGGTGQPPPPNPHAGAPKTTASTAPTPDPVVDPARQIERDLAAFRDIVEPKLGNVAVPDRFTEPYKRIHDQIEFYKKGRNIPAEKAWTLELGNFVARVNRLINEKHWAPIKEKAGEHASAGRFSKALEELGRFEEVYKWFRTDAKPEKTEAALDHEKLVTAYENQLRETYLTEKRQIEQMFRDPAQRDESYRRLSALAASAGPAQRGQIDQTREMFFREDVGAAASTAAGPEKLKRAEDRIRALKSLHEGNAVAVQSLDRLAAALKGDLERVVSESATRTVQVYREFHTKFEATMAARDIGAARHLLYEVFQGKETADVHGAFLSGWPDPALLKAWLDPGRGTFPDSRKVVTAADQAVAKAPAGDLLRELYLDLRTTALLEEMLDQAADGAKAVSRDAARFKAGYAPPLKDAASAEPVIRKAGEGISISVTPAGGVGKVLAWLSPKGREPGIAEDDIVALARRATTAAGDPYQSLKALLLYYYAGRYPAARTAMEKLAAPETKLGLERYVEKLKTVSSEADEATVKKLYEDAFRLYVKDERAGLTRFKECVEKYAGTDYMKQKLPNRDKSRLDVIQSYLKGEGGAGSGSGGQPMGAKARDIFGTADAKDLGRGRVELTYGFKDDREMAMFVFENPAVAVQRLPAGGVTLGGQGGWYLNVPFRGNVQLEVSFRTDTGGTLGFALHGEGGQKGYAVFVDVPVPNVGSTDAIFRMPVGEGAQVAQSILQMGGQGLELTKGTPLLATFTRDGNKLRFSLNKGRIEAEDATYQNGRMGLWSLQSGALIERFKVTGEVEPAWLSDRMK